MHPLRIRTRSTRKLENRTPRVNASAARARCKTRARRRILVRHTGAPSTYADGVIFKRVGSGRPYPDHGLSARDWAALPPRQVRLDQLTTTKDTLQLAALLDEDSTFFGDLFAHVVEWKGELYLEDGLHRALRAALQQRLVLHARVHTVED